MDRPPRPLLLQKEGSVQRCSHQCLLDLVAPFLFLMVSWSGGSSRGREHLHADRSITLRHPDFFEIVGIVKGARKKARRPAYPSQSWHAMRSSCRWCDLLRFVSEELRMSE